MMAHGSVTAQLALGGSGRGYGTKEGRAVGGDAARPDGGKGIVRYRATRPNPKARERASVIPTTVLNLEAGRVEAQRRTIRKLAKALDVEPRELVED